MLDFDLASMYSLKTKALKQTVKRNLKRFPSDFMFELTKKEFDLLRSQIVTSKNRGGIRYMPFAFTEQGLAMLSSVINSDIAIEININIMRAFIAVRQMITNPPTDNAPKKKKFNYKAGKKLSYIEEFPYRIFNFSDSRLTLVN